MVSVFEEMKSRSLIDPDGHRDCIEAPDSLSFQTNDAGARKIYKFLFNHSRQTDKAGRGCPVPSRIPLSFHTKKYGGGLEIC